jgi:hypothetical protein
MLAKRNLTIASGNALQAVHLFDDINQIANQIGTALGDTKGNDPHHPWPEQRHLALVRGPLIVSGHQSILTPDERQAFGADIKRIAQNIRKNL